MFSMFPTAEMPCCQFALTSRASHVMFSNALCDGCNELLVIHQLGNVIRLFLDVGAERAIDLRLVLRCVRCGCKYGTADVLSLQLSERHLDKRMEKLEVLCARQL
jgi:hypothetical protein